MEYNNIRGFDDDENVIRYDVKDSSIDIDNLLDTINENLVDVGIMPIASEILDDKDKDLEKMRIDFEKRKQMLSYPSYNFERHEKLKMSKEELEEYEKKLEMLKLQSIDYRTEYGVKENFKNKIKKYNLIGLSKNEIINKIKGESDFTCDICSDITNSDETCYYSCTNCLGCIQYKTNCLGCSRSRYRLQNKILLKDKHEDKKKEQKEYKTKKEFDKMTISKERKKIKSIDDIN